MSPHPDPSSEQGTPETQSSSETACISEAQSRPGTQPAPQPASDLDSADRPSQSNAHTTARGSDNVYQLFVGGAPKAKYSALREASNALRSALESHPTAFLWVDLSQPERHDIFELGDCFDLPPLAIEDTIEAHQRAKFERYEAVDFAVFRPVSIDPPRDEPAAQHSPGSADSDAAGSPRSARRRREARATSAQSGAKEVTARARGEDEGESPQPGTAIRFDVTIDEMHVFLADHFVIIIRHEKGYDNEAALTAFARDDRFTDLPRISALYRILDHVVDGYSPAVRDLEDHSDRLEEQIFTGIPAGSQDIFHLSRGIIEVDRIIAPLGELLNTLSQRVITDDTPRELTSGLRDVADHVKHLADRMERLRALLREIFSVNSTIIAERQNEDMRKMNELSIQQNDQMKKISAWAGILFFPSLVAANYGMNFDIMPELHWTLGYPLALTLMAGGCFVMWRIFKKVGWL